MIGRTSMVFPVRKRLLFIIAVCEQKNAPICQNFRRAYRGMYTVDNSGDILVLALKRTEYFILLHQKK